MKIETKRICTLLLAGVVLFQVNAQDKLSVPPQDKGLPYTRSSRPMALEKIKGQFAVFVGSRYAYAQGFKVRLDETHWRSEAVNRDGVVYIPVSFAGILSQKTIKPDVAPTYLSDRWVYSLERPKISLDNFRKIDVDGLPYVAFADVAKAQGLQLFEYSGGLVCAGKKSIYFSENEKELLLSVITQFDTPEKFANPDIATQFIPTLQRQGKWTNWVKVTPEQKAILDGPETKWEMTPQSKYDFKGVNTKLLGSKVPAPGVYPRVLFSEEDIPMLAERIKKSKLGQMSLIEIEYLFKKTWWDPTTSDGKIYQKLVSGDLTGLEWPEIADGADAHNVQHIFKDQKAGIFYSHIAYVPECLSNMALYCLLTNDNEHGRQTATAIANYFKLREPLIDEWNSVSDSEFGSSYIRPNGKTASTGGNGGTTHWRGMHNVSPNMNLGLALDFGGKWMTTEQKDLMRHIIAKSTYGRRAYGQDGSVRFRDINWASWDLPNFLALVAIEGLEGFDKEAYISNCESVKAFCEWGIDDSGVIYESNGKVPGGCQSHLLCVVALARRGDNLFGHPHLRKLLQGQVQMTSPNGSVVVNSGTQYTPFSRQFFSPQVTDELKAFYPENRCADYLLAQMKNVNPLPYEESHGYWVVDNIDIKNYRTDVAKLPRLRMSSPMYSGFVRSFLYDTDYQSSTTRVDLKLPLDFNDTIHGVYSGYSDATTDATWMCMMVRPDHYLGGGHHHADAGMFHFSALGVNWFTESPFMQCYAGKYHNEVLVDGIAEAQTIGDSGGTNYQAAASYLGVATSELGSFGTANLTNSYSYRWQTQPSQIITEKEKALGWELDPSAQNLKIWAGTSRYKMRPWYATYNCVNYMATSRSLFNPMKYVYRSTGLVRGKHSYGVVVDDLKKDDQNHLYQWTAMLNGGVWQANMVGLSQNQAVLAARKYDEKNPAPQALITPEKGEPLLLVCSVSVQNSGDPSMPLIKVSTEVGEPDKKGAAQTYNRIAINSNAKDVNYRVLLVPFKYGEALPKIKTESGKVTIEWADQKDDLRFDIKENRTSVKLLRDDKIIVESK